MPISADFLIAVPAAAQPSRVVVFVDSFPRSGRYLPKIVLLGKDRWLRHGVTLLRAWGTAGEPGQWSRIRVSTGSRSRRLLQLET